MSSYNDFVRAVFSVAWNDGRAFLGKSFGKIIGLLWLPTFTALGLAYAESFLRDVGIQLTADGILKAFLKAGLGILASGLLLFLMVVGHVIFYAPFKLWRREKQRSASFPYGSAEPLFEVMDFYATQPSDLPPYREATANIRLRRDVSDAQIKIWAYHDPATVRLVGTIDVSKGYQGEEFKIVLATAGVHEGWQHFGQKKDETFGENAALLVRIEMIAGKTRQERRFQIMAMHPNQHLLQVLDATSNPYFWPDQSVAFL